MEARHRQIEFDRVLATGKAIGQWLGVWLLIRAGELKWQTIGKDTLRAGDPESSSRERRLTDFQRSKAPRTESQTVKTKLQQIREKTVLVLEMLWAQKCASGPNDGFKLLHSHHIQEDTGVRRLSLSLITCGIEWLF